MPRGRPRKKSNSVGSENGSDKSLDKSDTKSDTTMRKDPMKPQERDYSKPSKPEGGMAHSENKKEDIWGGKKPPYPRSEIYKNKHSVRSGMALIKE